MSRIKHETIEEKKVISHKDMHGIVLDFGPTQFFNRTSFIAAESNPYKLTKIQKNRNESGKCIDALEKKYGNIKEEIKDLFAQKGIEKKQEILVRIAGTKGFAFLNSVNTAMGKKKNLISKEQATELVNLFNKDPFNYKKATDTLAARKTSHAAVKHENALEETANKLKATTAHHNSINNYFSEIEKLIRLINPKLFKMHFKKFGIDQLVSFAAALDVHLEVHAKRAKKKPPNAAGVPADVAAAEVKEMAEIHKNEHDKNDYEISFHNKVSKETDHIKVLRNYIDPKKFSDSILDIQNVGKFNQLILELHILMITLNEKIIEAVREPQKYTNKNKCSPAKSWAKMFNANYGYK